MRLLKRSFFSVDGVEVEICIDENSRNFVRHHTYWSIAYGKKNPDPFYNCVVDNLKIMTTNRLPTIKWAGHDFKFERISFDEGMEVEAVLIPLKMFEDFIRYHAKGMGEPPDHECTRLSKWLEYRSLEELVKKH